MNKGNELNEAIGKNIFTPGNYYLITVSDWKCFSRCFFFRRIYRKVSR